MIKSLFVAATLMMAHTSIYTLKVNGIDGNTVNFGGFYGKKILIVNIATNSPRSEQIGQLQQLYEQYQDSLVIIGFPSNSFGNENRSDSEILQYCQSQYSVDFPLATKGSVIGTNIQPFYYWLTHKVENGVFDNEVKGDFQKYLFDRDGTALGVYTGGISPADSRIVNAITGTQN